MGGVYIEPPELRFGLSCPYGGNFYVCQKASTKFVGCCLENPCAGDNDGDCPFDKLRIVSFDPDKYSAIKPQACSSDDSNALWYTCSGNKPPFMGCCSINPCDQGLCPRDHLSAARLSDDKDDAAAFTVGEVLTYATSQTSSSTSASSTSLSSTTAKSSKPTSTSSKSSASPFPPMPTETSNTDKLGWDDTRHNNDGQGLSKGEIAGISVGVAIFFILSVAAAAYLASRKRKGSRLQQQAANTPQEYTPEVKSSPQSSWFSGAHGQHSTGGTSVSYSDAPGGYHRSMTSHASWQTMGTPPPHTGSMYMSGEPIPQEAAELPAGEYDGGAHARAAELETIPRGGDRSTW